MAVYTTIASGTAASGQFVLPDTLRGLAIAVPSHSNAWGSIAVQFAPESGGPYGPFWQAGASSATIFSGAGPGYGEVPRPPSQFGRIVVTNSTANVASFTVLSVRH